MGESRGRVCAVCLAFLLFSFIVVGSCDCGVGGLFKRGGNRSLLLLSDGRTVLILFFGVGTTAFLRPIVSLVQNPFLPCFLHRWLEFLLYSSVRGHPGPSSTNLSSVHYPKRSFLYDDFQKCGLQPSSSPLSFSTQIHTVTPLSLQRKSQPSKEG